MSKEALADITTNDDGKFIRTAIRLESKGGSSVDVLTSDGQLLCRLNLSDFGDGNGNVDVILNPKFQKGKFGAWVNGQRVVDASTEGSSVHSVAIHARPSKQVEG